MPRGRAALTVDVETFQQLPAYRAAAGTAERPDIGLECVGDILELLNEYDATSTFFTVSEVAESRPDLVAKIADRGHEIGSHTRTHRHLPELDAEERRAEIADSKATLEDVTGAEIAGFRAPSFQTTDDHLQLLAEAGYTYDSSVLPARSIGWYGGGEQVQEPVPGSAIDPDAPAGIAELPVAVMPWLRLPLTGAWLRLFGVHYAIAGMRWLARRGIAPVLYVHPWEFADLPAVEGVPRRVYARTGPWMHRAVERLLSQDLEFVAARDLAAEGMP